MGRITSSIGLITGTPIQDTVDQLVGISAIPRDRLLRRNEGLSQERSAVTDLTVLAIGLQLSAKSFGTAEAFSKTKVSSSSSSVLSATSTGTPAIGEYSVQTLRTASTQAFRSNTFGASTKAFGTNGSIEIRGGGYVDRSALLSELNGGRGIEAGAIRITDRSGAEQIVDLSTAVTVDDVLTSINSAAEIDVYATTDGDAIRLEDRSGVALSNLIVEEVGGGATASDLGLLGINEASDSVVGTDVYRLSEVTRLSSLRDGRGIGFGTGDDIQFTLRDGTIFDFEFGDFSREASESRGSTETGVANAKLTFTAAEPESSEDDDSEVVSGTNDGIRVRFIDDPDVTAGNETVQRIETANGTELVFGIEEGVTTAADIVDALAADETLSDVFSAVADGDGTGLIAVGDEAVLTGGAAIEPVDDPDIGDLLRVLNAASPDKLRVELAPAGDGLRFVDLTSGGGEFKVKDLGTSTVAADLGIAVSTTDSEIDSVKLHSGLSSVSLNSLSGGSGLGTLTSIDIETADGSTANVDLSASETLQDVLNAINDSGLELQASVDSSGAGIQVRDLSGGTATFFSISSGDDTAASLGIESSTSDVLIRGESLDAQFVARSTRLEDLNQGRGVGDGSFKITDSLGEAGAINLKTGNLKTVGDVVDAVNGLGLQIIATINETGDGIRIVDVGEGEETLSIEDSGSGTTAAKLGLAGTANQEVIDGEVVQTLNGRQVDVFQVSSTDTLSTLAAKIRDEGRFASASLLNGPSGTSSLTLLSARGGASGRLSVRSSGIDFGFSESTQGRDAAIAVTTAGGSSPTVFTSVDGVFRDSIDGMTLTAKSVSDDPVEVKVTDDLGSIESGLRRFADQYNTFTSRIEELTFFNSESDEVGILFGSGEILRVENSLSELITARVNTGGTIRTAVDIGFQFDSEGQLSFDANKFQDAVESDPDSVEAFLTTESLGFVAKIDRAIDAAAGEENGSLINRSESLSSKIDSNSRRIESMNRRLDSERERLLKQFNAMEAAIAELQTNQQYISQITYFGDFLQ